MRSTHHTRSRDLVFVRAHILIEKYVHVTNLCFVALNGTGGAGARKGRDGKNEWGLDGVGVGGSGRIVACINGLDARKQQWFW